jgi:hypothetical protein
MGLLGAAVGLAGFYVTVLRPWHLKWGSTEAEVVRPVPGDELVPKPRINATRSISIHATPAEIWPWLMQMGYKRAGWYSYDALESAVGVGDFAEGGSSRRIIPELQNLKVGDLVPAGPEELGWFKVVEIIPERALVLRATINPLTGRATTLEEAGASGPFFDGTWVFNLDEITPGETRLMARLRGTYRPDWVAGLAYTILEPVHFLMERKMLEGIRERVEAEKTRATSSSSDAAPSDGAPSDGATSFDGGTVQP